MSQLFGLTIPNWGPHHTQGAQQAIDTTRIIGEVGAIDLPGKKTGGGWVAGLL